MNISIIKYIPAGTRLKKPRNGLSIGTGISRAHEKELRDVWNKMMRKKK